MLASFIYHTPYGYLRNVAINKLMLVLLVWHKQMLLILISICFPFMQARILALNASYFLKAGGHFVISIKANCIDSTSPAEAVFAAEVKKLQQDQFKPMEQVTLEPFERDHACVVGAYRVPKKAKN